MLHSADIIDLIYLVLLADEDEADVEASDDAEQEEAVNKGTLHVMLAILLGMPDVCGMNCCALLAEEEEDEIKPVGAETGADQASVAESTASATNKAVSAYYQAVVAKEYCRNEIGRFVTDGECNADG